MLLVCVYIWRSDPDESRFNHNCAFEAGALPCDIKVKVLPDGSYSRTHQSITKKKRWHDISDQRSETIHMMRIWPLRHEQEQRRLTD